ncbi:MAG: hypothetical protein CFE45_28785 [Burkholderiales bacterium PBB5]|nr:MAG: hypothetical protein CFE45_28785 [Burkholderiales bacterium PBB5]
MSPTQAAAARQDYRRFLTEQGFKEEHVRAAVENHSDMVPMPPEFDALELRRSPIAGRGLFTTRDVEAGDILAPARLAGKRTPAGRYTNHGPIPNAQMVPQSNGDLFLVASEDIARGTEVLVDYRQAGEAAGHDVAPKRPHMVAPAMRRAEEAASRAAELRN